MNRRNVSNALVSMAGVLAETNAEADVEIASLRDQVKQLEVALAQHRNVVDVVRSGFSPGALPGPVEADMGPIFRVPASEVQALRAALKGCP